MPQDQSDKDKWASARARDPGRGGPGVDSGDAMAEAARKLLRYHFQKMLDHEAGARAGEDDAAIHRMRVATRRMRAAVLLFKPTLKSKALKPHRAGLRTTARALGDVRDFDVLLSNLRNYQVNQSKKPKKQREALMPLIEAWQSQRASSHEALVAYLNGEAYRNFVAEFDGFLSAPFDPTMVRNSLDLNGHGETLTEPDIASSPVCVAAGDVIWHRYSVVRAYGPFVKTTSVEQLHALRIETKYLRYVLEFFTEVLGLGARKLIERVIALQDHLGALNDADVATRRAHDFLESQALSLRPEHHRAIKAYAFSREQEVCALVEGAPRAWHDLDGIDFRRRLARVLADL